MPLNPQISPILTYFPLSFFNNKFHVKFSTSNPLTKNKSSPSYSLTNSNFTTLKVQLRLLLRDNKKMSSSSSTSSSHGLQRCKCGIKPCLRTSWTVDNPGRRFRACENWKNGGCNFFSMDGSSHVPEVYTNYTRITTRKNQIG